eukprot:TRINITY_DN270_c0_g2_i1.p1 TRINITY_DN270_c0_g2~~TRINITY_DN270_c0_g2_i1.p1  ORF type:complete len:148 (-),score=18.70 TRINITY_DN270_c0_g2_i1:146-568(-)
MATQVKAILSRHFTRVGTAALMGNIEVETGGSFSYTQKQNGGGNGYGLFQFDFLRTHYFTWLSKVGRSDSAESQILFVAATISGDQKGLIGSGNAAKVNTALNGSDLVNATTVFCNVWERPGVPHLDRRIAAARKWYYIQ